jgi:hypothetical protein
MTMKTLFLSLLALAVAAPSFALFDASMDANKDGSLDASEVVSAAKPRKGQTALQAAAEALQDAVKADLDKDGKLSAKETALYEDRISGDAGRIAGAKHAKADADGDGSLTRAELEKDAATLKGTKAQKKALVDAAMKADADKDGKISKAEYEKWHSAEAPAKAAKPSKAAKPAKK